MTSQVIIMQVNIIDVQPNNTSSDYYVIIKCVLTHRLLRETALQPFSYLRFRKFQSRVWPNIPYCIDMLA